MYLSKLILIILFENTFFLFKRNTYQTSYLSQPHFFSVMHLMLAERARIDVNHSINKLEDGSFSFNGFIYPLSQGYTERMREWLVVAEILNTLGCDKITGKKK